MHHLFIDGGSTSLSFGINRHNCAPVGHLSTVINRSRSATHMACGQRHAWAPLNPGDIHTVPRADDDYDTSPPWINDSSPDVWTKRASSRRPGWAADRTREEAASGPGIVCQD